MKMKNQARVRFLLPVLTLVCCLFAGTASAQSVPVTLRVSDAPLEQVLSAIEKQTTYLFVYDKNVDVACRVSIDVKDTPLNNVLNTLFQSSDIAYAVENTSIILSQKAPAAQPGQPVTVTGKVVDASGMPVIGAAVIVKNDSTFLNFAIKVADMIMDRVKTDDAIPYWDYDAPVTEETPRDASAASVTASALIELSTMVPDGQKYLDYAEKILKSLSSDAYLAKVGDNQGFILMHSVGSLPNGSEIDTPLNYADYYYLEALKRFMELKKLRVENGELRVIQ